ncbi:MAG: hypothetical protein QW416_08240 [Candidatus Nitrosocaldaceae archaeon]
MTSNDLSDLPRDLNIDEDNYKKFEELKDSKVFKQSDTPMKSIFIYALALGWNNKIRKPLKKKKGSIPSSTLSNDELWLLYSIAYTETKDISIILKGKEVAKIVEEYANGGIDELYKIVIDPHAVDEPYKRLESRVMDVLRGLENE